MKLVATKSMTYNTRRLLPGDVFEARERDARILIGIRKAQASSSPPIPLRGPSQEATPVEDPGADDDMEALRSQAESLGIEVDRRWGVKRLRAEISRAEKA